MNHKTKKTYNEIINEIRKIFEAPFENKNPVLRISIDIHENICYIVESYNDGTARYYEKKLDESLPYII